MTQDDLNKINPCTCGSSNLQIDCTGCTEYSGKLIQFTFIECCDCSRELWAEFDHNIDGDHEFQTAKLIEDWNNGHSE